MMSKNYTEEQKNLKAEVKDLQQQIHEQEQQAENIEQFVQRVKRNSTLTELTPMPSEEACQGGLCRCTGQVQRQSAGRRYISSTTLWATFPWMSC